MLVVDFQVKVSKNEEEEWQFPEAEIHIYET